MKVFISWSGQKSKELGEILCNWIASTLQSVRPYFTPDDIEKGSRWSAEIAKELEGSDMGVMVLTRENLSSPWIMFEAGALSKQLDKSKICPILFGVENTDLVGPVVQFQATSFTKKDMKKLVKSMNNACGDESKLDGQVLDKVFERWWPELEDQVNSVMGREREGEGETIRSERELIEEILSLSRHTASRIRRERGGIDESIVNEMKTCIVQLMRYMQSDGIEVGRDDCRDALARLNFMIESLGGHQVRGRRIVDWPERERIREV